jgi:hypothetical protein
MSDRYFPKKSPSTMEVIMKLILTPNKIISKAKSTNNKFGLRIMIKKAKIMNKDDKHKIVLISFYH